MTYYGSSRWDTVAALPTGESMNPTAPQSATYFDPGQTAYILFKVNEARTRPTRIFTSFGHTPEWKIGTILHLHHDQTGAYLGEYRISGIVDYGTMETAGEVPNLKIKHCVAK